MTDTNKLLAQCNISRLKFSLEHPDMREFYEFLEPVNQLADKQDGFIWRLKSDYGEASSNLAPVFNDPFMIINISVWKDVISLHNFTFNTVHQYFLKNRSKWLSKVEGVQFVMWWIDNLQMPTIEEAMEKLKLLETYGASAHAFDWKNQFDKAGIQLKNLL